jgi:hypothetical protein
MIFASLPVVGASSSAATGFLEVFGAANATVAASAIAVIITIFLFIFLFLSLFLQPRNTRNTLKDYHLVLFLFRVFSVFRG